MDIVLASGIILFAAAIQGITGFGFSLLSVPLLAFLMPLEVIVPVLVIFSLGLNIIVFTRVKGHVNKGQIVLLICFGFIALPIGIWALRFIDPRYIKLIVGLIVMISAVAMHLNFKLHFKNQSLAYGVTGFLSGILNGSSSLSGPPVILMLSNEGVEKSSFRKTLATYFMVLNIVSIPMFIGNGLITKQVLMKASSLLPAMIIGVLAGVIIGNRIPEKIFRRMTLLLIFIMGILTILSAL